MANSASAEQFKPQENFDAGAQNPSDESSNKERIEKELPKIDEELSRMNLDKIAGELNGLNKAVEQGDQIGMRRWAEKLDKTIFMDGLRAFWDHLPNFFQNFLYSNPLSPVKGLVDAGFLELGDMTPEEFDQKLGRDRMIKKVAMTIAAPGLRASKSFMALMKVCDALNSKEKNFRHWLINKRNERKSTEAKREHGHAINVVGNPANLDE